MLADTPGSNAQKVPESRIFGIRVAVAIIQAGALYLIMSAANLPYAWPATQPALFMPLLLIFIYVPPLVLLGLGQMPARPLAIWAAVATLILFGLGYHDVARGRFVFPGTAEIFRPWLPLALALTAAVFTAHVLVVDSVVERRLAPPYPRHFDTAWKQGVQTVLTLVFVGVFWGVLYLGAELFSLVDIDFFYRLIGHSWFAYPATTLAVAIAIEVTDVQPALIRGARSIALTLFSWLLPLLAIILLGFLCSLPFISLARLWQTHFATKLLLVAAALLIFLINCCYQDGADERTASRIKRVAGTAAAIELIPLVGLAAWAVSLRVGQYGWTVERILAAAAILLAACEAVGYAVAAIRSPSWLKRIEITNFISAYVFLALFLLLFSPIADPARLMVADQVARLKAGKVPVDKFDFVALKFDGGRWGAAALAELSQTKDGPDAESISRKSARALPLTTPFGVEEITREELPSRIDVFPEGRTLPPAFYEAISRPANSNETLYCFRVGERKCIARFVTLRPGEAEVILLHDLDSWSLFQQDAQGTWRRTGRLTGTDIYCSSVFEGLKHDDIKIEAHMWPDLTIAGHSLNISPLS